MLVFFKRTNLFQRNTSLLLLFLILSSTHAVAQDWSPVSTATDSTLNGVYFTDRNMGWAVGEGGTVIHTSDGGDSWTKQESGTTEQLNKIYFFDELTGWVAGNNNLVLYTENGGEQWTERRPSSVSDQHITDVSFIGWKRGWAAGGPGGHIYYTDNSGLSWQRQASVSPDGTISAIQAIDHQTAFAMHNNQVLFAGVSQSDWEDSYSISESISFSASDFYMMNDTLGWVIGNEPSTGIILQTVDGGQEWNEVEQIENSQLRSITFVDEENGFVVGTTGTVIKTENGGESWEQVNIDSDSDLNDISFVDSGNGWIVGTDGVMYRLLASEIPDITYYLNRYPSVQITDEAEALDLLHRAQQYGDIAQQQEDPNMRAPHYGRMLAAIDEVDEYFGDSENEYTSQIPTILNHFWAIEHNEGAELFNESLEQDNNSQQIINAKIYLKNATTIQPDSTISYVSLANVYLTLDDIPSAISAMENAIDRMDVPDLEHYVLLIDLYHTQEKINEAIELSKKAINHHPEEYELYEILVNLFLDQGEIQEAISYLNILIDEDPEEPSYYLVRGAQLQYVALNGLEEALRLYEEVWMLREELETDLPPSERQEIENEISILLQEVHTLKNDGTKYANLAISDLEEINDLISNNYEANGIIGSIYHNMASILYQMRTLTPGQEEAQQFDSIITANLEEAKDHYEKAVTSNPEEPSYWEALYYIYLDLGMEDQAEQVARNENFENNEQNNNR